MYGFAYNLDARTGASFSGFGADSAYNPAGAQATGINDVGIVIGVAEDWERGVPDERREAPFTWSPQHGKTRLTDFTTVPFESILPAGSELEDANYWMRSINDHGQMVGSVRNLNYPVAYYEILFVLYPVLDYKFQLQGTIARPEGDLLVFTHSKLLDKGALSPSHFGKIVVHESSADAKTWHPLEHGVNGVEIVDQKDELQIRLPAQPRGFLRSRLADGSAATD